MVRAMRFERGWRVWLLSAVLLAASCDGTESGHRSVDGGPTDTRAEETGRDTTSTADGDSGLADSASPLDVRPPEDSATADSVDGRDSEPPRIACNYADRAAGVCLNSYLEQDGECHEPAAYEKEETLCDGKDNDCDGGTDEGCPCAYQNKSAGVCGDATVDPSTGECGEPEAFESDETSCDEKDNDCDGEVDEAGPAHTYYRDADADGFGDSGTSTLACSQPSGYVPNGDDCDDSDASVHPGADEICGDGIDSNCNGEPDEVDSRADRWCRSEFSGDARCGEARNPTTGNREICCFREPFSGSRYCVD